MYMSKLFLLMVMLCAAQIMQAQKVLNNAIIKATSETQMESDGESNGMMMRGPGETKIKITLKDSMSRVDVNSDFANNITIMDRLTKTMTNLTESQGEKTGYTTTEAERAEQKKRIDSITKASADAPRPPGAMVVRMGGQTNVKNIEYVAETKTINGFICKKAIITTTNNEGEESKVDVWYTDAYMIPANVLQSVRMIMNFGNLAGLPIQYVTQRKISAMNNEITMTTTFTITEVKENATIEAKEFEVPKGYKVKTYEQYIKDNPDGMRRSTMMMRAG
jgi:GLPGLI family protein